MNDPSPFSTLKDCFPEKLERAERERLSICLPDLNSLNEELDSLDSDFFDLHILQEQSDEGWFRSRNRKLSLIVESESGGEQLKLLSGPGYQASFSQGIYKVKVLQSIFGVNKVKWG